MSISPARATALSLAALVLCISTASKSSSQQQFTAINTSDDVKHAAASRPATVPDGVEILNRFVAAEASVREALNQHAFKRDVVLQTIGPNGEVTGEYIRNSQFVFDDHGRRVERVIFHPKSTITEMRITKEDIQDLASGQLLGIDIAEASKYQLTYVGVEVVDSRQLYAVEVTPRTQPDPNHMKDRYFVGRVWLDPESFQIVKIKGIVEPQGKQRFPVFETWRQPVRNALAFPVRTEADDVLHFKTSDVHYRIKVRYYEYKLFASKVSVTEVDDSEVENSDSTAPEAKPTSPSPSKTTRDKDTKPPVNASSFQPNLPSISSIAAASCTENRTAPPTGPYHWPADKEIKVYFTRNMFTPEQRQASLEAMATWTLASETGSGVRFVDAGETDSRMSCSGCLTVARKDVYKRDKHHYAFFHPMREEGGVLVSAWIDLDFGITKPNAVKAFMMHELGHGMGLWDCVSCKGKKTIMNGFPGMNKDNGLDVPSVCDLATVRNVYEEERQVALTRPSVSPAANMIRSDAAVASAKVRDAGTELLRPNNAATDTKSANTNSLFWQFLGTGESNDFNRSLPANSDRRPAPNRPNPPRFQR